MGTAGSTLFAMTWKDKATPSGRLVSLLRASAPRTSGKGCGSWPTPNAGPQNDQDSTWQERRAVAKAKHGNNGFGLTLVDAVTLTGWATPAARDWKSESATDEFNEKRWDHPRGKPLSAQATLAGGKTPNAPRAHDSDNTAGGGYSSKKQQDLPDQTVLVVGGEVLNGSTVPARSTGQLNPAFSRWLMGLPAEWDDCAPTVTRSSRRSRPNS